MHHYAHEKVLVSRDLPVRYILHNMEDAAMVPRHWHRSLELNFTLKGGGVQLYIDGQKFSTQPGDIFMINTNQIHAVTADYQKDRLMLSILFPIDFIEEMFPDFRQYQFECLGIASVSAEKKAPYQKLVAILTDFIDFIRMPDHEMATIMLKSLLYEMMYYFIKDFSVLKVGKGADKVTEKYFDRLTEILTYIEKNSQEIVTIKEVAEAFHFSEAYFSRFFTKYMGISFSQYLTEIRLNHAEKLLRNTDLSLTTIALEVGFANERTFTRNFKKYYQDIPSKKRAFWKSH